MCRMKSLFISLVVCSLSIIANSPSSEAESNAASAALAASTNGSTAQTSGETLKPQEAEQALTRLKEPTPSTGTWRRVSVQLPPDPSTKPMGEWDTTTNVVYLQLFPDGRRFVRKEITRRDKAGKFTRRLYVHNQEGYWAILQSVAILYPEPAVGKDAHSKLMAWWTSVEEQTSAEDVALEKPPFVAITGERFRDGDRARLHITQTLADDAFAVTAKKAKKKIPLLVRPFVTTSLLERWFAQAETFRLETTLDETTGESIGRQEYGIDGYLHIQFLDWSRVDDLPLEAYEIPSGLKQLRPKSLGEAKKLERKFRRKESKGQTNEQTDK